MHAIFLYVQTVISIGFVLRRLNVNLCPAVPGRVFPCQVVSEIRSCAPSFSAWFFFFCALAKHLARRKQLPRQSAARSSTSRVRSSKGPGLRSRIPSKASLEHFRQEPREITLSPFCHPRRIRSMWRRRASNITGRKESRLVLARLRNRKSC